MPLVLNDRTTVEHVLERLERVRRTSRGWSARCPAHEDRSPSLSIAEGRDGRALLRCFAGCEPDQIVRAIGLEMPDLFSRDDDRSHRRRHSRRDSRQPVPLPRDVARELLTSAEWPFLWNAAKVLALLPGPQARLEVLRRWRYYADRCDVGALLQTSYLIRGVAMFTRCTARGCDDLDVTRAVQRLVRDLERNEVAA